MVYLLTGNFKNTFPKHYLIYTYIYLLFYEIVVICIFFCCKKVFFKPNGLLISFLIE